MKPLIVALAIAMAMPSAAPARSAASPQLAQQVANGIARYGFDVDTSRLTVMTLAQLKGILSSHDSYLDKKLRIRTVLRNAGMM